MVGESVQHPCEMLENFPLTALRHVRQLSCQINCLFRRDGFYRPVGGEMVEQIAFLFCVYLNR